MADRIAGLCEADGCVRPQVVAFYGSPRQALSAISHADLVVGMRLHSLIFAASTGVPAVAIDYDPKVRAMAERMGNGYVVSVDDPPAKIAQVVLDAWAQRDKLRAELARRVPALKGRRDAASLRCCPLWTSRASMDERACSGAGGLREHGGSRGEGSRDGDSGRGGHVVTLNPEMTLSASEDAALEAVIAGVDLVVPDGIGVVRALSMLGYRPRGRVPGIELAANVMEGAQREMSVYLVGAEPGVAQKAASAMSSFPASGSPALIMGKLHSPRSRLFWKGSPNPALRSSSWAWAQAKGEMDSACAMRRRAQYG